MSLEKGVLIKVQTTFYSKYDVKELKRFDQTSTSHMYVVPYRPILCAIYVTFPTID